jgi:hypothetical protein
MLHHSSQPFEAYSQEGKNRQKKQPAFAVLFLVVIPAVVFFVVLIYSIRFAGNQAARVYAVVQHHSELIAGLPALENTALSSADFDNSFEATLSTVPGGLACPPSRQDAANIRNNETPHPDDSSTESSVEHKSTKAATVKTKDASTTTSSGTPVNGKPKVTPYSHKTKVHSGQKHFGVGLRFTI